MNHIITSKKPWVIGVLAGVLIGIVIALFRMTITLLSDQFKLFIANSSENYTFGWPYLLVMMLIGLYVTFAVKQEANVGGSGVLQVKLQLESQLELDWRRILFYKLTTMIPSLASGMAIGRGGPSIQIGATVGSPVFQNAELTQEENNYLFAGSAGAGMAATFNAPVAGILFVFEEFLRHSSRQIVYYIGVPIVTATITSTLILGNDPVISLENFERVGDFNIPALILLGIIIGGAGAVFNKAIIYGKHLYKRMNLPFVVQITVPFLLSGAMILFDMQLFGAGDALIPLPLAGNVPLQTLVYLLIAKLVMFLISFTAGMPAGMFFPLLSIGALIGNIFGSSLALITGDPNTVVMHYSLVAMAAFFATIVRAPLTGIILVIEMTGAPVSWTLPVLLAAYTADITAEWLGSDPIYDSLMEMLVGVKTLEKLE